MGEAKYRKLNDPTFGHIPKNAQSQSRGIVISCPMEVREGHVLTKSSMLDPQELRFALLFWEKLAWPTTRAVSFPGGPDAEFLEGAGVLSRPMYEFNGAIGDVLARAQMQALADLNDRDPGAWAIAQGENSLILTASTMQVGNGAYVELHRAIPIPTVDVPLNEILEFRERRRDELLVLRRELDTFVSDIESAEDHAVALAKHIASIDSACADLLKLGREWRFPVLLSNIKASVSLGMRTLVPAFGAGWAAGISYGMPAAIVAAGVAGAACSLELKADLSLRTIKRPMSPFRYAYRAHEELR
ncbi:TPA: hypothetical protein SAY52_005437 [Burkholderia cenocepacia]|uniref:DUF6236 family protein n=1 Tax=Burkholderia sp. BCC0506 TaxID=2676290 RepID=UPI001589E2DC|nr:DUF6236 family protein [Burkholderia sp. BCC0506]HEF5874758.1 hypothetical protein [Burkholderia cenocepacia]